MEGEKVYKTTLKEREYKYKWGRENPEKIRVYRTNNYYVNHEKRKQYQRERYALKKIKEGKFVREYNRQNINDHIDQAIEAIPAAQ